MTLLMQFSNYLRSPLLPTWIPTFLLKQAADVLVPNCSTACWLKATSRWFQGGVHHADLKNPGPSVTKVSSYQSLSNLSVLSKLLQCLVMCQMMQHLSSVNLRPDHSTETAGWRVLLVLDIPFAGCWLWQSGRSGSFVHVRRLQIYQPLLQQLWTAFGIDDIGHC